MKNFNKKQWFKEYRAKNKARIDQKLKEWKEKNKAKYGEYQKKFQSERYQNNKEQFVQEQLKRTAKYRDIVYAAYGNVCNCCGETNSLFLTVDHVNNDGHKDKDKNGDRYSGTSLYIRIIKADFPPEFQILCYNCNMGKARNKGVCPHKIQ